MVMSSNTNSINSNNAKHHPYALCISTMKPPPAHQSTSSSTSNDAVIFLCPYTGTILSNSNPAYSLRCGGTSSGGGGGVTNLCPFSSAPLGTRGGENKYYLAYVDGKRGAAGGGASISSETGGGRGYAALLQLGSAQPKWKCTLPERPTLSSSSSSTLLTHPNGRYVLAGCPSGNVYLWNILHNGSLIAKFNAHHRPVTSLCITPCGEYLLTGGEDGIVNMWSFLDIVSSSSSETTMDLRPIHTWSAHSLPITSLTMLSSNRAISTSMDRLIVIMELTSGNTLASIAMPVGISCVSTAMMSSSCSDCCFNENDNLSSSKRIYAGGINGCIYVIDLDVYSIKKSAESATIAFESSSSGTSNQHQSNAGGTLANSKESIVGLASTTKNATLALSSSSSPHVMELRGHEGPITSLVILNAAIANNFPNNNKRSFNDYDKEGLIASGGQDGSIRIWSIASRCCIRTIRPWSGPSASSTATTTTSTSPSSPCNSILLFSRVSLEGGGGGHHRNMVTTSNNSKSKRKQLDGGISSLYHPLRRFESSNNNSTGSNNISLMMVMDENDAGGGSNNNKRKKMNIVKEEDGWSIPLMRMTRDEASIDFWERRTSDSCGSKRKSTGGKSSNRTNNITDEAMSSNPKEETEEENAEKNGQQQIQEGKEEEETDLQKLRKQLEEAQQTIERWEQVNHKLVSKLNKSKKSKK
mmetsp:Transcript_38336/g.57404  ORF Transcript_38336/g.57404 Transcript_38336/m.57404 type:complete len:698 (-) Transcript_38336:803-2896(-)